MNFMRHVLRHFQYSLLSLISACTVLPYSRTTDYPGEGPGKVEVRTESPSTPIVPPLTRVWWVSYRTISTVDGKPAPRLARYFNYELVGPGGSRRYVESKDEFQVGSCVRFVGGTETLTQTLCDGLKFTRSGYFHYQVRANDGTLYILASDLDIEVGSCVAFKGYADGPSRTHWSLGRVTMEKGSGCNK